MTEQVDFATVNEVYMFHPVVLQGLQIRRADAAHYFRHLYFLESLSYTEPTALHTEGTLSSHASTHLASVSLASTLQAQLQLLGEIPRVNMLRHLFLLQAPFINRERLSEGLAALGFLPLMEEHQTPGGDRLDAFLIGLLEAYEQACGGRSPEECLRWLKGTMCDLDAYLAATGAQGLRFLRYKSIRSLPRRMD